jgi:hypothetical protein
VFTFPEALHLVMNEDINVAESINFVNKAWEQHIPTVSQCTCKHKKGQKKNQEKLQLPVKIPGPQPVHLLLQPTKPAPSTISCFLSPLFSNSTLNNIDTFFFYFICIFTYQMISLNYVQIIESCPEGLLFDESFRIDFYFFFFVKSSFTIQPISIIKRMEKMILM